MARHGNGLVSWLRKTVETGYITAREMAQGLGRLGFAAVFVDWEKPFLGPLYAWSSAIPLKVATMLRALGHWIADRLEKGDGLQKPVPLEVAKEPLSFFTDAKAEEGRAWMGGFLELVPGCQKGLWFSLEVEADWAPCLREQSHRGPGTTGHFGSNEALDSRG